MRTWNRIRYLFNRCKFERDLQEELRIHREMAEEDELRLGTSEDEARHNASCSIGSTVLALEDSRSAWSFVWFESLVWNLWYGLRCFSRARVFAVTVIITIGLALGLNTVLFTAFNAYVLSPSLCRTLTHFTSSGGTLKQPKAVASLGASSSSFAKIILLFPISSRRGGARRVLIVRHSSNNSFRETTSACSASRRRRVEPLFLWTPPPGTNAVIVLSYTPWKAKFSGDPGVIGRTVSLGGHPFEIVGVARRGFVGITNSPPDFWAPMTMYSQLMDGPDLTFLFLGMCILLKLPADYCRTSPPRTRALLFLFLPNNSQQIVLSLTRPLASACSPTPLRSR